MPGYLGTVYKQWYAWCKTLFHGFFKRKLHIKSIQIWFNLCLLPCKAALLDTFNCCGLSANFYIHWLNTQAIVYELLYFDVFEGVGKRVWKLIKDLKNDKEFHDATIKTLICYFNQNTPVRRSVLSSIHPSIFAGYEMTEMGTKYKKGTKWLGYEMTTI